MKRFQCTLAVLALTMFSLATQGAAAYDVMARHEGIFTEGTNSGTCYVTFFTDGAVNVSRYATNNPSVGSVNGWGRFMEGRTGLRTFVIQTERFSITGTSLNGVVRAKSKNFVTKSTGTLACDVPTTP